MPAPWAPATKLPNFLTDIGRIQNLLATCIQIAVSSEQYYSAMVSPQIEPDAIDEEQLPAGFVVGEFVVETLLGRGGFARVYRAKHPVLGHRVAIKVLTRAVGADPEAMRRFIREAQAASRVDHENVVKVLGFGKLVDGRAYQLMELVDGPSLDDHLGQQGTLPLPQTLSFLDGIAKALSAAHALGIIHRDLKPANVLILNKGGTLVPRLTDFGIAKAIDGEHDSKLTRTGSTLGTPTYMSPEQALGQAIGTSSDVYAFGVLAFELLTGNVPFDGESPFAIMMQHVQATPPLVSKVAPALGTMFDQAILEMLNKQPDLRPASIAAAMARLHSAAASTTEPSTRSLVGHKAKRRRITAIALATAIGMGSVAVALFAMNSAPSKNQDAAPLPPAALAQPGPAVPPPAPAATNVELAAPAKAGAAPTKPSTKPDAMPPTKVAPHVAAPPKNTGSGKPSVRVGTGTAGSSSKQSNDDGSYEVPADYAETP